MTRKEKILIGRIQTLFGKAKGVYENDRDPMRNDHLVPLLQEGFKIAVALLAGYPQITPKAGEEETLVHEYLESLG